MAEVVALTGGPRRILGLTDPPGAGKSTVAADLVDALRMAAAPVPMDGFHRRGGPGRIRHRTVSHGVLFPMSCTSATAAAVDEPAAPQAMFIDEGAG
jgi:hypothetical protein